jgi:hypothetical protein
VWKPAGKRPVGRPRHKWEDNIRTDVGEGCEGVDWIHVVQNRAQRQTFMKTVLNLGIP